MNEQNYIPALNRTIVVAGQQRNQMSVVEISEIKENDIEINGVLHNQRKSTTTIFFTNVEEVDAFIKVFEKAKELLLSGKQIDSMFGGEIPRMNKTDAMQLLQAATH